MSDISTEDMVCQAMKSKTKIIAFFPKKLDIYTLLTT